MNKGETPLYPPARTIEERENQLINLSMNLAEKRLREGTASPSEIVHFLKLGTLREQQEREKLQEEVKLLRARTDAIEQSARDEEQYAKVLDALRLYNGMGGSSV